MGEYSGSLSGIAGLLSTLSDTPALCLESGLGSRFEGHRAPTPEWYVDTIMQAGKSFVDSKIPVGMRIAATDGMATLCSMTYYGWRAPPAYRETWDSPRALSLQIRDLPRASSGARQRPTVTRCGDTEMGGTRGSRKVTGALGSRNILSISMVMPREEERVRCRRRGSGHPPPMTGHRSPITPPRATSIRAGSG
jgi:hypothetical protein